MSGPEKVLAHLRRVGWVKGRMYANYADKKNSPCCLVGALLVIYPLHPENSISAEYADVCRTIHSVLSEEGEAWTVLSLFNDRESTTWADIERVLTKASAAV